MAHVTIHGLPLELRWAANSFADVLRGQGHTVEVSDTPAPVGAASEPSSSTPYGPPAHERAGHRAAEPAPAPLDVSPPVDT